VDHSGFLFEKSSRIYYHSVMEEKGTRVIVISFSTILGHIVRI